MKTKSNAAVKKQLVKAIARAQERERAIRDEEDGLLHRLATIIAEELGIVEGRRYKVIPRPGNAYTVMVKRVGSVAQYHAKLDPADLYIGVLVYCERKNGHDVFRSEWLYTNRAEFIPYEEKPAEAEKPVRKSRRAIAGNQAPITTP